MGLGISKAMNDNLKKQQDFMLETQRLQLERQLMMQNMMRERMMAFQVARAQELFLWTSMFAVFVGTGCVAEFLRSKDRRFMIPLLPVLFVTGYNYDFAFGNKIHKIREGADRLLRDHPEIFALPGGNLTFDQVEKRRHEMNEEERFKPNDAFL